MPAAEIGLERGLAVAVGRQRGRGSFSAGPSRQAWPRLMRGWNARQAVAWHRCMYTVGSSGGAGLGGILSPKNELAHAQVQCMHAGHQVPLGCRQGPVPFQGIDYQPSFAS